MRIVFMGTPDFAVGTLQALVESGKHEIAAVVTQPDRPKGRGQKMLMTPVKEYALSQGLPVYQPAKVKTPEVIAQLRELRPEIIVVAAFGQLLNQELLALPPLGCVNVHASLLPKYRGAAPIHYAILQGEKESGVTIMQMDIGMDTGDMLSKVIVPIGSEMTMGELHDELKVKGAELLVRTLDELASGAAKPEKQNETEATYAKLLDRAMEKIDWNNPAAKIHDLVRGFNPAPGAFTRLPDGKKPENMENSSGRGADGTSRDSYGCNEKRFYSCLRQRCLGSAGSAAGIEKTYGSQSFLQWPRCRARHCIR